MEASHGEVRSYSFMSSSNQPTTNIFVPLLENAMPDGVVSCAVTLKASTKSAVEASHGEVRSYSFTAPPVAPITNIFVPLLENAMPFGLLSCILTKVASTKEAVRTSNVPTMGFPAVSRTAPGSTVSSGVVSPATVARCDSVSVNVSVTPSASVTSSDAVRVTPPV